MSPCPLETTSKNTSCGSGTASASLGGLITSGILGMIYPLSIESNFDISYSPALIEKVISSKFSLIEVIMYCFKLPATLEPSAF